MHTILSVAIASALAIGLSAPALAGRPAPVTKPEVATMVVPASAALIAIDPANREIGLDIPALAQLKSGTTVTVAIAGVGRYPFVIDRFDASGEVTEVSGHLAGDEHKRMTLGLHGATATGLIAIPGATYAIGYGNANQALVGLASTQWLVNELGDRLSIKTRSAEQKEILPPTAMPMHLDVAALNGMQAGDSTVMQLPDIGATRITLDQLHVGESTTWIGHLTDFGPSYTATITYSPAGADGYIVTPEGAVNLAMSNLDQPYLFNPSKAGFQTVGGECTAHAPVAESAAADGHDAHELAHAEGLTLATASSAATVSAKAAAVTGQVIDVLVYYTPGMLSAYGSLDKLTTRVDQLVALSNQAYTAGKLPHQIRRVGLELVNVADNNSNSTLLSQFATGQGAFSGVAARRTQVGADLVALLRPLYASAQGSCGVAYVGGYNQSSMASYAGLAYAVISDGRDQTGQSYYCEDVAFAHELGHNMGLMHDRATTLQQNGGVLPLPTGATAYAYGYAVSGKFGTVMSYTSPKVVKFSNPLDSTCAGTLPCGVAQSSTSSADNAAALALTMPLVAAFRPTVVVSTDNVYLTGTTTVNGTATAGVTFTTNNANVKCAASGSTGMYTCTIPKGTANLTVTPGYVPAGGGTVTWQPASWTIASATANATQNFAGTLVAPANVYVSGKVTINGVATAGVSFATNNAKVTCSTSTSTGAYSCTVPKGTTALTITPKYTAPVGYTLTWSPASASLASVSANVTQNFAGTTKAQNYTLSGTATVNGKATAGVTFTTNNAKVTCTNSNSTGAYSCTIPAGTTGLTVTPKYTPSTGGSVSWSPASLTLASVSANATQNFTGTVATASGTYSVTIKVLLNGVSTTSVPISISYTSPGAALSCSVTSGVSYVCKAVSGTKLTVTPGQVVGTNPITYTPTSQTVTVSANTTVSFSGVRK